MGKHQPQKGTCPPRLGREPNTDYSVDIADLDQKVFQAVDGVTGKYEIAAAEAHDVNIKEAAFARSYLLKAMKGTHRAIRLILKDKRNELSVNCLPLTRLQLERCFTGMLLEDDPKWFDSYVKNSGKYFLECFWRYQAAMGHLPNYRDFAPDGKEENQAVESAKRFGLSDNEIATLKVKTLGGCLDEARYSWEAVPDMPSPGNIKDALTKTELKVVASILYPLYDDMSHFSHGGLTGNVHAAFMRGDIPTANARVDKSQLWYNTTAEPAVGTSLPSMLFVATLFSLKHRSDPDLMGKIVSAWEPYFNDGSAIGVSIWDNWAKKVLGALK